MSHIASVCSFSSPISMRLSAPLDGCSSIVEVVLTCECVLTIIILNATNPEMRRNNLIPDQIRARESIRSGPLSLRAEVGIRPSSPQLLSFKFMTIYALLVTGATVSIAILLLMMATLTPPASLLKKPYHRGE